MLDLLARDHDLSAALHTADLEVHADAQDKEAVIAAWMGLFQFQRIADPHAYDLHGAPSFSKNVYFAILYHKTEEL